jgi:hypothetical protein
MQEELELGKNRRNKGTDTREKKYIERTQE